MPTPRRSAPRVAGKRRTPPRKAPARRAGDPYAEMVLRERAEKDRFLATQPESPFSEAGLPFHPLVYFPVDPEFRVTARLREEKHPSESWLRTSQDGHAAMRKLGTLSFSLKGRRLSLELFHAGPAAGNIAFLPFRDRTSGSETYGPGRYLTLELREEGIYELDFNRSFNPYCAYTPTYECPFPPPANDLPVPVRAGERVYDPGNNPSSPEQAIRKLTEDFRERQAHAHPPGPSSPKLASGSGGGSP